MKLGEAIRSYRDEHSMSTTDFAKLVGLSRPYVYMLEVNRNTNGGKPIAPSMNTLAKLSKVLNVPINDLIDDDQISDSIAGQTFSDSETILIKQFRLLNPNNKLLVAQLINSLCAQQQVATA